MIRTKGCDYRLVGFFPSFADVARELAEIELGGHNLRSVQDVSQR